MPKNQNRNKSLFLAAIEIESSVEREQFLNRECGENKELRNEIVSLLDAHENPPQVMDRLDKLQPTRGYDDHTYVGQQIGPYKLLEVIGEGGMGTVYMAEQTEPVRRRVALKLIKTGMDTRQVVARFETERQALALMDHPNIAKQLDAGSTESGRPYFVMELVKGKLITEFCDEQQLDTRSRLKLFQQVCLAVQHAHQKGIIHRDIKPSNVLVAMYDDQPVPKVIDFGVAKATGEKLTAKTMFTRFGQIVGTLEYMSPEQAQFFNQLDIDTRSDIYSLGAILYELLAGEPPFDREKIKNQALDETLRMIREDEPTRPSTKMSETDQRPEIASRRKTSPDKLRGVLQGELDWIVLKAIEKERSRRYETANDFAADINNYLQGEAVVAHPPSRSYRLRKFSRKYKGLTLATSLISVSLLTGIIGTSIGLFRAEAHRQTAEVQRDRAVTAESQASARADQLEKQAKELKQVSDFQAEMLDQIDPPVAGGRLTEDVMAKLEAALTKAELSEAQRTEQIENFTILWRRVNAADAASALIDETILKPAVVAIDRQFADQPLVAAQLRQVLAGCYMDLGLFDAALPLQEQALATRRRALGDEHIDTVKSVGNFGVLLGKMGRLKEAEAYVREAVETARRLLGEEDLEYLWWTHNLGEILQDIGGPNGEAERCLREALEGQLSRLGDKHLVTLVSMESLGQFLTGQGKSIEGEVYLQKSLEGFRRELGDDHPRTLHANDLLGRRLSSQGELHKAEQILRENLKKRRRVLGEENPATLSSISNLAAVLISEGKLEEAEPYLREAVERSRRVLGEENIITLNMINNLGAVYFQQEKWNEAETYFRETVSIKRRVLGSKHPDTLTSIVGLGATLRKQGKLKEAEPYHRESVATGRRIWDEAHPKLINFINHLGLLLDAQGKYAESANLLTEIKEPAFQAFTGNNQWLYGLVMMALGNAQKGLGEFSEAETNLLEAQTLLVQYRGPSQKETIKCTEAIVKLYTAWHEAEPDQGYDEKVDEWKRKLNAQSPRKNGEDPENKQ